MPVNWSLGLAPDIGGSFMQGMEQGRARKKEEMGQNALAAYAQNPGAESLNALAPHAPEFAIKERTRLEDRETQQALKRSQMIGQAAQWADTPEKWDAAVTQLARIYPELGEYKGQFSPEARMAAISAAGEMEAHLKRTAPVNVGPGSHLVDPLTGQAKFSAPFAPRPVTVREGETVVEYAPSGGIGGGDPGDIFTRMIGAESNGQQFAGDGSPLTSPAGAIGIAQVMPGTAPEAARLAGLPFDDNRYRTDPEYNAALGKAYFEKQLETFGDPALAVAAYNAGPGAVQKAVQRGGDNWIAHVPRETQDYVRKVMGGGQSGPRVIAQGAPKAPKERWRTLTPQEAQDKGLPPGIYQEGPAGQIQPVSGTTGKNAPEGKAAYSQSAIDAFDRAISTADRLLKHPGLSAAVGSGFDPASWGTFNPLTGNTLSGTNAADFSAELDAMKAQVFLPMVQSMKGMGALSNAEGQKLTDAIGALDPKMSEGAFKASVNRIVKDLTTYRDRGAQPAPQVSRPAGGKKPSVSNW